MDGKTLMTVINKCFFQEQSTNNNINVIIEQHIHEFNLTHVSAIFHKAQKNHIQLEILPLIERLDYLLKHNGIDIVNCQHVSNLLFGIRNYYVTDPQHMPYLLTTLKSLVLLCTTIPTAQNFGNSLLGLSGLDSKDKNVRLLIGVLGPLLYLCPENLSSQNISNSLYSLLAMNIEDGVEVVDLIVLLTNKINRSTSSLSGQSLTNACFSLQNMNSKHKVIRKLVAAITRLVLRGHPEIASGQLLSNSLFGLQNMRSLHYEVRELLAALLPHLSRTGGPVLSQHLSNAIFGCKNMSTYYIEVKLVVQQITRLFPFCTDKYTGQGVGNSIYGFQNLESTTHEVQSLLVQLSAKVNESDDEMTAQELANAIFGCQNLSNEDCVEVKSLLTAIDNKCSFVSEQFTPNHIQQLFGLNLMTSCPEIDSLLKHLREKIFASNCNKFDFTLQIIGNALYGINRLDNDESDQIANYLVSKIELSRMLNSANEIDYRAIIQGLITLLSKSNLELRHKAQLLLHELLINDKFKDVDCEEVSANEKELSGKLKNALNDIKNIIISTNKFAHGFSYDIMIEVNEEEDEEIKTEVNSKSFINVEIDGPTHSCKKSKHFHDIRDSYLRQNGVTVLRYDLMDESYSFEDFILLVKKTLIH